MIMLVMLVLSVLLLVGCIVDVDGVDSVGVGYVGV